MSLGAFEPSAYSGGRLHAPVHSYSRGTYAAPIVQAPGFGSILGVQRGGLGGPPIPYSYGCPPAFGCPPTFGFSGYGVTMTDALSAFRALLEQRLGVTLNVTSGVRDAANQASVMLTKAKRKDAGSKAQDDDITYLYQRSAPRPAQLLASGRDLATWTRMIQEWQAQGYVFSNHQRADAFDVDISSAMTGAQVLAIANLAKSLGAKEVLIENAGVPSSGPWDAAKIQPGLSGSHVHIGKIPSVVTTAVNVADTVVTHPAAVAGTWLAVATALAVAAALFARRRAKKRGALAA